MARVELSGDSVIRRRIPRPLERLAKAASRLYFRFADPGLPAYQLADILLRGWGAWRLNAPLRVYNPDIVILPDHGAPCLLLRRQGSERRVLIAHHNPARFLDIPGIGRHSSVDIRLALRLERRALTSIDAVISPSAYMAKVFKESFIHPGQVTVVPNLIDGDFLDAIEPAPLRQALQLPSQEIVIAIPAGGNAFKGARYVPELIRRLTAAHSRPLGFFISGEIPAAMRGELGHLPKNAKLFIPGGQEATEMLACLRACNFALLPSLVENFSMAGLECLHYGIPVVAFDTGGNSELIRDGVSGHVVPYLDMEAFVAKAGFLLDAAYLSKMRGLTLADAKRRLGDEVLVPRLLAALGIV